MMYVLSAIIIDQAETLVAICFPNAILTILSWIGYKRETRQAEKDCYYGCIWVCLILFMFGLTLTFLFQFGGESFRRFMWVM
jgi:hypothetical protein